MEGINPGQLLTQPLAQQQTQQIPISSDELYANQIQEERVSNFISQISPDKQLMELQWRLKGYILDPITQEWNKVDPKASEPAPEMVSRYVSFASSILNQSTTLTNMAASEINKLMHFTIEWFVDDMDTNAELYSIEHNYTERTRIGMLLLNFISTALKRSQNGVESRRLFGTLILNESQNTNSSQSRKKTFMDSIKDWKM